MPADDDRPLGGAAPERGPEADDWDPEGLRLARAVAAQIAATARTGTTDGSRGRRPGGSARGNRSGTARSSAARSGAVRSGAGPDDRDPQLLDRAIERLVADHGWGTEVAVAGAISRWDQIVGADVAAHCRAESYADEVLTVRADSTAWATQVRLLAPTLVRRLNEELGDGTVRRVAVVGPAAPGWGHGRRRVRGGQGPRDTYG